MTDNGKAFVGLLVLGGLGLIFYLATRKTTPVQAYRPSSPAAEVLDYYDEPASAPQAHGPTPAGMVRYKNSERREYKWDLVNMIPLEVIITRESVQLP